MRQVVTYQNRAINVDDCLFAGKRITKMTSYRFGKFLFDLRLSKSEHPFLPTKISDVTPSFFIEGGSSKKLQERDKTKNMSQFFNQRK